MSQHSISILHLEHKQVGRGNRKPWTPSIGACLSRRPGPLRPAIRLAVYFPLREDYQSPTTQRTGLLPVIKVFHQGVRNFCRFSDPR